MRTPVVLVLVVVVLGLAGSVADAKDRKPPPPVPPLWFGSFDATGPADEDKPAAGVVTVDAAETPPKDAILVNPHDPDRVATAASDQVDDKGVHTYAAAYLRVDYIQHYPVIVLVEASAKPVAVKPTKSVRAKLEKLGRKAGIIPGVGIGVGVVDLDADGIADLAMVSGCTGNGVDGVCAMTGSAVFQRAGKGWKQVGPDPGM